MNIKYKCIPLYHDNVGNGKPWVTLQIKTIFWPCTILREFSNGPNFTKPITNSKSSINSNKINKFLLKTIYKTVYLLLTAIVTSASPVIHV